MSLVRSSADSYRGSYDSAEEVFTWYKDWCSENGERFPLRRADWQRVLKDDWGIVAVRSRDDSGFQRRRLYLHKATILQCIRKAVGHSELTFDDVDD